MFAGPKKVILKLPEKIEEVGSFAIAAEAQSRPKYGTVVTAFSDYLKEGDRIYYNEHMARKYEIDGVQYEVIDEEYIDIIEAKNGK
jgi:co-chaperonin GroES (HSP10)